MPAVRVLLTPTAGSVPIGATAVIVDVLRATTTLSFALANGAARVLPAATAAEALALRERHPGAVLCGERDGRRIPGFDLGNSPLEYAPERVAGRTLVFASTNGSQAMLRARDARRRVLGAFVNASAVVAAVCHERQIAILCAGKLGAFCLEDGACAGWLCRELVAAGARADGPDARLALALAPRDAAEVSAMLEGSAHGRYLRALGADYRRDVARCAEVDALDRAWEI